MFLPSQAVLFLQCLCASQDSLNCEGTKPNPNALKKNVYLFANVRAFSLPASVEKISRNVSDWLTFGRVLTLDSLLRPGGRGGVIGLSCSDAYLCGGEDRV